MNISLTLFSHYATFCSHLTVFFKSWSVHVAAVCVQCTSFLTGWFPVQLAEKVPVQFDM